MKKIFLKNKKSKVSIKDNSFLNVSLKTNKRLLPSTSINGIVNLEEQYNEEREKCDSLRLICTINPVCSNVLFNNLTEVIFNEGSNYPIPLNYVKTTIKKNDLIEGNIIKSNLIYSLDFSSDDYDKTPIQDTQLSRFSGFTYHCGLDMFNNHLLRTNTFKSVTIPKDKVDLNNKTNVFNTINDYLRDYHGINKVGYSDLLYANDGNKLDINASTKMHLYLSEDIDSFKGCVSNELKEEKGWFGFINTPQITTYDDNNDAININKPINNKSSCGFIDMYPERELFYFTPLYNQFKHKIEKNWNYCLTYPSSSTTEGISFINTIGGLNSLKIGLYDDNVYNSNGIESIYICSSCKHGLEKNDIINIYETLYDTIQDSNREENATENSLVYDGAMVNEIIDEYSFYVTKNGVNLSEYWMSFKTFKEEKMAFHEVNERVYCSTKLTNFSENKSYFCPVINDKINLYKFSKNFSFKKVVNSIECEYYVRIFSKLPNWKFSDTKPTEYEMYKEGSDLIKKYSTHKFDFESHVGKLAFARNIYGDDVSQITFTDDIVFSNLKDNLNQPIKNIYLTILKNNRGYKDWYKNCETNNSVTLDINSDNIIDGFKLHKNDTIEYSHCFGKLTSNFNLSYESLINNTISNVKRNNNLKSDYTLCDGYYKKCSSGLNYSLINSDRPKYDDDEVVYDYFDEKDRTDDFKGNGDMNFYGDLVCFSPSEFLETSLQMSDFRFNTAQRELYEGSFFDVSKNSISYDEILYDDYDYNSNAELKDQPFEIKTYNDITNVCQKREGYFYQAHYEIPIKSVSNEVLIQQPKYYTPLSISILKIDGVETYVIKTMEKSYLELNDKFMLYNVTSADVTTYVEDDKYYQLVVTKIKDNRTIYATLFHETGKLSFHDEVSKTLEDGSKIKWKMFKPDVTIPDYAYLLKDKSFNYVWREVIQNGMNNESTNEDYIFTNGAFYLNKSINFYLKRQDPNNYVKDYSWDGLKIQSDSYPYSIEMKKVNVDNENNYYEEDNIVC